MGLRDEGGVLGQKALDVEGGQRMARPLAAHRPRGAQVVEGAQNPGEG